MNLVLGVIPKKISNRIFLFVAAVILTGGFFAVSYVLAAHTPTVTVSPLTIKGGASSAYTFSVDNAGANFIYYIKITAPLGFTVNNNLICPAGWTSASAGTDITCTGDPDPGIGLGIQPGSGTTVSFTAIAPGSNSTNPWVVQTKDNAFASVISNPVTLVDATAPTIQSITTKDADGDGRVETATIVFSEAVDDSTFSEANFTLGGAAVNTINTGTADDNIFDIVVTAGVAGTEAKDITYTQGTGADMVGNLLANIVTGTIVEVDDADPVFMSARTQSPTTIDLTFSEDLLGSTDSPADFSVDGFTIGSTVENAGVITLTLSSSFGTGVTPAITYDSTASNGVKDLNNNTAPSAGPITPSDGIAPVIASTRTVTTTSIEITFSETMSAVDKADFAVAGNTIDSVTFTAGQTTATFVLQNAIGTGDAPPVSTVALPTNTKDNASLPNTITGSLISTPVDDIAPTVIITATTAASPTKIAPIGMTITFSENVIGFIIDDLVVGNGTAGNFSGAGAVYNFDITSPGQGAVTVNIAGAVAKDAADNDNAAAVQFSIIYDSVAPDINSIVLADSALKVGETSLVIITFSEAITGFTNADITTIDNGILTGVSSADGGTTWTATFTPTDGITDNTNIITVNKTGVADLAGNAGVGSTSSDNYAIDTVRPTVIAVLTDSNLIAGETTTVTFTFSETPTDFTAADVIVGSGSIGAVSATGNPLAFTATLTPTVDTEEATNIITVGTGWTDAAGNAPAASTASANYTVETKKPTVALASVTANPTNGLIAVTAEFSEGVIGFDATDITVDNGAVENFITVDGNSYTFNVNPTDGANFAVTIDVLAGKATDAAGNNNTASNQITRTSDTVAPATPAIASIAGDNFINDSEKAAVHVIGTAEAGATVSVTLTGGATVGPVAGTANGVGVFDITLDATTLTDGIVTPSVTATDAAGNTSAADTDPTATKDTAAPSAPVTPDLTAATDSNINTDDITNDATPDFITTAEIGSTIAVYDGAIVVGAMTATGGADTITVSTLSDGVHDITVKTTDAAGNESPASSALSVTVDTAAPNAVFSAATDDVGSVTGALISGATTDDISLALSGTNESGSTVQVFNGADSLAPAIVSGAVWSYTATIVDGTTYQFNVKETDVAGNTSSATSNFTVIGDTTAPAAPAIASIAGDNFINDSEKAAVHVIGTAEAGSTVSVTLTGGATVGPVAGTANGVGVFDITLDATTLTDGTITPSVTATDAAGNTSAADTDPTATKDTAAPTITSITSDATAAGILKVGDTITFTLTPGAAEVGANVLGSYNGVMLAWSPNGGSTAFTATYTVAEGNTDQTSALQISGVTITDAFSNTSSTGAGTDVVKTIDAHTPTAPTTVTLLDPINNTNKTTVTLRIIGESGTTYNYSIEDATPGSPVSSSGTLTGGDLTVSGIDVSSLDNGTLTASVTLTDAAGNVSSASADTATKDASVPAAPVISSIATDDKINNAEKSAIVVAGTAEADSLVSVTLSDGANNVTETQQLTGGATAFSIIIDGDLLNDGTITPSVTATDAAGNTSAADTDPTALKDTSAPVITINDGTSSSWTQTDTIILTVTETNPSTNKYGFSPDDTCDASDTISTNFTSGAGFNITGDRNDYLCAKATDTAGNETYQRIGQLNTDNTVPDLTLNSMFTGQTLTGGNVYPISWTANDLHLSDTPVKLEYSVNGGTSWTTITEATANDGSENWTVPSVNTSNGLIRTTVTDLATNASQADSDTFSITYSIVTDSTAPVATLNSPNGGETWENNAAHLITWTATDNITAAASLDIKLEYSTDGGTIWTTIIADTENDGAYSWTPTGLSSTNVLIKITATDAAGLTGSDISNTALTIATPVAYPESICTGSSQYSCSISLSTGWNLVSFPIIPTNTAIDNVLAGLSGGGTVDIVKYYDSTDPDDWKSYVPGSGGDLTSMQDGKGYWISMTAPATLTVTGTSAPAAPNPPSTYDVISGWNLIGYKSLTAYQNASAYLSAIPSGYIVFDQNNINKTSSYLQHGKGYWLWSTGAGSIVAGD